MSFTVSHEEITIELFNEVLPLLEIHRDEITAFKDIPLNVNIEKYIQMQKLGMAKAFFARDENNKIIGYVVYFVNNNMHYNDYKYAVQDILYVEQSKRGLGVAMKLLRFAEQELIDLSVNVITQHVKIFKDFVSTSQKSSEVTALMTKWSIS